MSEPNDCESFTEQLGRLNLMAENADGDWDLSDNDRAAITSVLGAVQNYSETAVAALAQLAATEADLLALRSVHERLVNAVKAYNAKVRRVFGDVQILHTGRAGLELQEVLDAAAALAASTPTEPTNA